MITFLDPTQSPDQLSALAPRLESLRGTTVGLLWNNRPRGDRILRGVAASLIADFGVAETVFTNKLRVGVGAPPEIIDELARRCGAVVVGVGD